MPVVECVLWDWGKLRLSYLPGWWAVRIYRGPVYRWGLHVGPFAVQWMCGRATAS